MSSFGKKKKQEIDLEQHELLEHAHKRIKQKKRLYYHLVIFLIGSIFLILANKVLKYGEAYDWSIWIVLVWTFLIALHTYTVFVTNKFMGQNWEREQRERLVNLQKKRIDEIQKEIETDFPLSKINKKKDQ
ncbi:MAG: 2TM domain-containing protein [Bacteroidota bacterium]|uniref:2TM domain-containing protein n=1 Tax=Flagellimonas profundi TaxID=2915620 RepID=A0ABS3FIH3_9FLAO|nr:2TM domain-containing protein [Allomuricauda profundi]MBO0342975.1 2TM domain-containing protein [Allomuricauda profundi]MEC7772586.1 2TM domain-containing protein [Bacteroidota bacterium]